MFVETLHAMSLQIRPALGMEGEEAHYFMYSVQYSFGLTILVPLYSRILKSFVLPVIRKSACDISASSKSLLSSGSLMISTRVTGKYLIASFSMSTSKACEFAMKSGKFANFFRFNTLKYSAKSSSERQS